MVGGSCKDLEIVKRLETLVKTVIKSVITCEKVTSKDFGRIRKMLLETRGKEILATLWQKKKKKKRNIVTNSNMQSRNIYQLGDIAKEISRQCWKCCMPASCCL